MGIFNMDKFKENQEKINKNRDEKLKRIKEKDRINKEKYLDSKEKFKLDIKSDIEGINKEGVKIKEEFNSLKEDLTELKKEYHINRTNNCCPRCKGNNLVSNKSGVGVGKAVAGGIILGPVGLLAGAIGKNKIQLTCLDCGKQFKL